MAPIKLEDHIKERLEDREIAPTVAAWERITTNLDANIAKKQGRKRFWFAIAASFIGGLFIASLFFKPAKNLFPEIELVEGPNASEKNTPKVQEQVTFSDDGEEKSTLLNKSEQIVQETKKMVVIQNDKEQSKKNSTYKITTSILEEQVTHNEIVNKELEHSTSKTDVAISDRSSSGTAHLQEDIDNKINEVVERVNELEEEHTAVTDAEIDKLLLQAQREIISKQILDQKTNKIDAHALLLDVEAELYPESFRDKIFNALKDGFLKTRDAFANRNN